jgi:Quinohemoprotein amine dehydrogenase, alpha subunit domain III
VVISGGNFQSGAQCDFGAGVRVNSCAFNSASQLTAALTIASAAGPGTRDVTATNPDGQRATLSSGFFINSAGLAPIITSVSPNSASQGQNLSNVVLKGSNFQNGAQCDFGAGITVTSCVFGSSSQLTATLTIAVSAATGAHNVSVTNPDNQSSALAGGFSVTQGTVRFSPSSLSFNDQAVGTASPSSGVVLTNNMAAALTINALEISGDFVQANNCPALLPSGGSCTINISFRPTTQGTRSGSLSARSSPNSPQAVNLSGTGTGTPNLSLAPTVLNFGGAIVSEQSTPQTVTLRVSNAPLTIRAIDFTSSGFRQENQCPPSIAAGGQCPILVFFTPGSLGPVTATMHIQDDAADSPQAIQLRGQGSHFILLPGSGAGQTISAGQTASFTVGLKSISMQSESVSLSCSGAPATSSCNLSQYSLSLNGNVQMFTVTVTTIAHSTTSWLPSVHMQPTSLATLWVVAFIANLVFVIAFLRAKPKALCLRGRAMQSFFIALLLGLAAATLSCSGATSNPGAGRTSGTPSGRYAVTISGTSSNPANPAQAVQLPFIIN